MAISENLAQFMGSVSDDWLTTYPWYRRIDERLRRGI
jgi:hypothetical protein